VDCRERSFREVVIIMKGQLHPARILSAAAAAVLAAATAIGAGTSTAQAQAAGPAQPQAAPAGLGGQVWTTIPTHAKVVALTFDAGANADGVASILATLKAQHVPASFFLTGKFASTYPAQAKAMAAAGRTGDHSVSHPYFTKLTDTQIRQQVQGAQQTIKSVTGTDPAPWFRFPYGDYNAHTVSVVNSLGFVPVGWTVDTLGWEGTSGGITVAKVVSRVLGSLRPGEIVLMHCGSHPTDHSTLDASALPSVISQLRSRGYQFVTVDALRGLGYHVLSSGGTVSSFGAPNYGGVTAGTGVTAVALAADRATGGYWILRSNGGVSNLQAPWYGSLAGKIPAGQTVTAIAASPSGGYLILTSGGGVYAYGSTGYGGLVTGPGVKAVALAAAPSGGYWVLRSNGGVSNIHAPWYGSLAGKIPAGQTVTAIAASPSGGYLILTSGGGVYPFGAPGYGSAAGTLPATVRATGLAADPVTGGYWILKSNGGVANYNAPWYGSLAGAIPAGQSVTAIAGE
jgi:peptidoglycan/xylan/chitin deacetylase (PgdA/CDA1 family)